jgi:hypothetical protein
MLAQTQGAPENLDIGAEPDVGDVIKLSTRAARWVIARRIDALVTGLRVPPVGAVVARALFTWLWDGMAGWLRRWARSCASVSTTVTAFADRVRR